MKKQEEDQLAPEAEELIERYKIIVDKGQEQLRIDKFLVNKISGVSRTRFQAAADAGVLLVNGKTTKSNYKVRPSDEIVLLLPKPEEEFALLPENIPLEIIFEDDDLLVINKPAGLVMHPAVGNWSGTLVNGLLWHFKSLPAAPGNLHRPGLVHRIDKDTSGLIVVAKSEEALLSLSKQFFDHTVHRQYLALVWGTFKEKKGTITGHIGRNLRDRKVMDVYPEGEHGKHAMTHYQVVEELAYVTLVKCRLETGRTHQVRAHMKFAGHPLFSDAAYGGNKIVKGTVYTRYKKFVENCFEILPRQALHARSLGFIHPKTKKKIIFESPLPADFENGLQQWRQFAQSALK